VRSLPDVGIHVMSYRQANSHAESAT
jgi:hypothetical protein